MLRTAIALSQEAMNHIRVAPDREQAFTAIIGEMDMTLERSQGWGGEITSESGLPVLS